MIVTPDERIVSGMDKRKRLTLTCVMIALATCVITWLFITNSGADIMGAGILTFYILIPLASMILGFILGLKDGFLFFLFPLFYTLAEWLTTGLCFGYLDSGGFALVVTMTLLPGVFATGVGFGINRFRRSKD
jgi:uncharacterized membrane protein